MTGASSPTIRAHIGKLHPKDSGVYCMVPSCRRDEEISYSDMALWQWNGRARISTLLSAKLSHFAKTCNS